MTSLDVELQKLAKEAQNQPLRSHQRQLALNKLLTQIKQAPSLNRPRQDNLSFEINEDLFNEALSKTMYEVCKNIDKYVPERGEVMAWVNFILKKRFLDVVSQYYKHNRLRSLDELNTDSLPNLTTEENQFSEHKLIRQYLSEDPDNILRSFYLKKQPEVTWQDIAIKFVIEDQNWETISVEFGKLSEHTLRSFYSRGFKKFKPYFQRYLGESRY